MDDYWIPGQRMMGDIKFLDSLRAFDKDNVPPHIMEKIRMKYINMELFDPNNVKKVRTSHKITTEGVSCVAPYLGCAYT